MPEHVEKRDQSMSDDIIQGIQKDIQAIQQTIVRLETQMSAALKRIDEQTKIADALNKQTTLVDKISMKLDLQEESIKSLRKDVEELKSKPVKRWDNVSTVIITCLITAIITYILAQIGLHN